MNLRDFDHLNHKEAEQFSHLIERKKARKQMKRYRNTGDICEFFVEEENDIDPYSDRN